MTVNKDSTIRTGYAHNGDMSLFYEDRGAIDAPALLMIMGLGAPMTTWTEEFCEALCAQGFRVIRFDNRDVGLSGQTQDVKPKALQALIKSRLRLKIKAPYRLTDMAADAVAVLDELGIERVHLLGGSLGGTIAQIVAAEYGERVLTLNTIMSTTNESYLPLPKLSIILNLAGVTDIKVVDADSAVESRLRYWRLIRSPKFPTDESIIAKRALVSYRRAVRPLASSLHTLALLATGGVSAYARRVNVPTLIIHGQADHFVPIKAAYDLQQCIPHARLEVVDGMGHEVPNQLVDTFAQWVHQNASRASV